MGKKLTVNNKGLKNIIQKSLGNKLTLSENRIDSIIKEYLLERSEDTDYLDYEEKTEFSPKSIDAIEDMISGLKEIVGDMEIIKDKEGDVMIFEDQYADEILSYHIRDIQSTIDDLEDIVNNMKSNKTSRQEPDLY